MAAASAARLRRWAAASVAAAAVSIFLTGCGGDGGGGGDGGTEPKLTRLPESSPGKCMDGSPGGYYHSPATSAADAGKWTLFLEGGGECAEAIPCAIKSYDHLGSSKHYGATDQKASSQYLSRDSGENPAMATWNHVFLKYCSQDLWSGTRNETSQETFGFYFSGHIIFKEVLSHLKEHANFGAAREVVLAGASAGGIGTWINSEFLKSFLSPGTRLTLAPIAGFYSFAYPYTGPGFVKSDLSDFREPAWAGHMRLWGSYINPACAKALGNRAYACMVANYSWPFVTSPAFVVEAQTDSVQLRDHNSVPSVWGPSIRAAVQAYVAAWKANMTSMLKALPATIGLFSPACYVHTAFYKGGPLLQDANNRSLNFGQAFAAWYGGKQVRLEDDCGILCGTSCDGSGASRQHGKVEHDPLDKLVV